MSHRFGPWKLTRMNAGTAFLLLDDHLGPCRMGCRFCPHGWTTKRPPLPDAAVQAEIRASFREALAATDAPNLFLASMDILDYPGLFDLLDDAAGRPVVLATPGLAAADPEVARRLAARDVEVALTWLATDADTYARVGGNRAAFEQIPAAIANLRAHGVRYSLMTVVTADTVDQLDGVVADVVDRFGVDVLRAHLFYPDTLRPPAPSYYDQFPAFDALRRALERASARQAAAPAAGAHRPRVVLGNLPLCQVDLDGLDGLEIEVAPHRAGHNDLGRALAPVCEGCPLTDRCLGVHPMQQRHVGPRREDWMYANLARVPSGTGGILPGRGVPKGRGVLPGQGKSKGEGVLPGQGVPRGQGVLPGEGVPRDAGKPRTG